MAREMLPFTFRVHPADLAAWKRAAARSGMTLSAWIRRCALVGLSFNEPASVQLELVEAAELRAPVQTSVPGTDASSSSSSAGGAS